MSKPLPLRYHFPRGRSVSGVDCIGLPQIPDDALACLQSSRDNDLPPQIEAACDRAIAAAMAEHQRRRGAVLSDDE